MQISVTFRNMDSSDALKDYAHQKVSKVKKYFDGPIEAKVVLSKEKHRQKTEVSVLVNRMTFNAEEETSDMYSAIDKCTDKIERQVQKARKKLTLGKKNSMDMGSFAQKLQEDE